LDINIIIVEPLIFIIKEMVEKQH